MLDPTIRAATDQWLNDLRHEQRSGHTVDAHASAINGFLRWLTEQPHPIALSDVTTLLLIDYVKSLTNRSREPRLEPTTTRAYIGILARWLQHLVDEGFIQGIPNHRGILVSPDKARELLRRLLPKAETPVAPRMPDLRRMPAYYDEQLRAFLRQPDVPPQRRRAVAHERTHLNLLRNRALIATLFCSGGRIDEVLRLDVLQIRRRSTVLQEVPITGKGRRNRKLFLDLVARDWLTEYLTVREAHPRYATATPVFLSHGPQAIGARLSAVTAWRVVKTAAHHLALLRASEGAADGEIEAIRDVSPHSLRHFLAQALLDEGARLEEISAVLGHSSTKTTEQYYARPSDERAIEVVSTFGPRASLSGRTEGE